MIRLIACSLFGFASIGCAPRSASPADADDIYEAALAHEIGAGTGAGTYLMIENADPSPALMARLQKRWPDARPSSAKPAQKASDKERLRHISVGELKWIDRDTAEVRAGFSNGMDGQSNRHRLIRMGGKWIVEKSTIEAIS
jgi:hypothetical protein